MGLKEQLEEEKRLRESSSPIITPSIPNPIKDFADTEAKIKAFKAKQDLESLELGYDNFKVRESSIKDREESCRKLEEELQKKVGGFELQQEQRVEEYNEKVNKYNEAYALLEAKIEEVNKLHEEALTIKAKADSLIKSQTDLEKVNQLKHDAYVANMENSLKLLGEIATELRQHDNDDTLELISTIGNYTYLIQWLQYKKCNLSSVADVISVICSNIVVTCEKLQGAKTDNGELIKYLLDSVSYLEKALMLKH